MNIEVMKDDNQSMTERATDAKDAASNKMEETSHNVSSLSVICSPLLISAQQTKSEADKQAAKN